MSFTTRLGQSLAKAGHAILDAWGREANVLRSMQEDQRHYRPPPGFGRFPGLIDVWAAESKLWADLLEDRKAQEAEPETPGK